MSRSPLWLRGRWRQGRLGSSCNSSRWPGGDALDSAYIEGIELHQVVVVIPAVGVDQIGEFLPGQARVVGVNPATLRGWCKGADIDAGRTPGTTTADAARLKELQRVPPPVPQGLRSWPLQEITPLPTVKVGVQIGHGRTCPSQIAGEHPRPLPDQSLEEDDRLPPGCYRLG